MWTRNFIACWIFGLAVCAFLTQPVAGRIIYVDADATGANNGLSWADAYNYLQDALADADSSAKPVEIHVAQGTYTPDRDADHPGGTGDRTATFQLVNGVAIRGGYAGLGEPDPDVRDIKRHETILSGDLNGDDAQVRDPCDLDGEPTKADNSYHVVTGTGIDSTAILDGFTICAGNASMPNWQDTQSSGGGMYNESGSPTVLNCMFKGNRAAEWGGAIAVFGGRPTLINCAFADNSANEGGGLYNQRGAPTIINCTFCENHADRGGGMYNIKTDVQYGEATLTDCTFTGNRAERTGGGMYNAQGSATLTNCIFRGNSALRFGGAMDNTRGSAVRLTNCTFTGNRAREDGGAISCTGGCSATLVNTILWDDSPCEIYLIGGLIDVTYSDVQGGWPGTGNIDHDPLLTPDGHLQAGSPCVNAGDPGLPWPRTATATDIDGESRVLDGRVDIGADEFIDRDDDGLPDWWEHKYCGDPNTADPNDDPDGDGFVNLDEYEVYSSNPVAPPIHVNPSEGPFWNIQQGIDAAEDGDTVLVVAGKYTGAGNKNLECGGKSIILYAPDGPAATIIDCNDSGRGFNFHSGEAAAVIGFAITRGRADYGGAIRCEFSQPQIRNCVINSNNDPSQGGGGIYCYLSMPALADCTISDNSPNGVWMSCGGVRIMGIVQMASNDWFGSHCQLIDDGMLQIEPDVTLDLDNCTIRCNVSGPGTIQVDVDSELIIEADAVIDLGHKTGLSGRIICDGLLRLRQNSTLTSGEVYVSRASFEDNAIIANCVINSEAGAPYGQFFIEDNVHIWLDRIEADGDRYLDVDPAEFDCNNIHVGAIDVNITEGVGGSYGGLFELRGLELEVPPYGPNEFFCQVDSVPDFDPNTWTIERLELVEGAKLNLTNRFDFQTPYDSGGDEEVLYVRQLILGPNSVLNTAFNRLYYESLTIDPTAQVINVPLLGFSLNNIAFDDENEFLTRIKHNNFQHPENQAYDRVHVKRVVGLEPDPNGMMQMCNLLDLDPESLSYQRVINARAKGLFAKSSEDEILIQFEYLFGTSDPNVELAIYLTDVPELLAHNDSERDFHYLEVARLQSPPVGRPGLAGSGRFGIFQEYVWRGKLDFIRGTRIEFELIGPAGACVLINNWDPQVSCYGICMDINWDNFVNVIDFLTIIGEYGATAELLPDGTNSRACLDGVFSTDGYVDSYDVLSWDWAMSGQDRLLNFCELPLFNSSTTAASIAASDIGSSAGQLHLGGMPSNLRDLLIAGKRGGNDAAGKLQDRLYILDRDGLCEGWVTPASDRCNIRLVQGPEGELCQINSETGVLWLDETNDVIIPPGRIELTNMNEPRYDKAATVYVGIQGEGSDSFGRPILDAAFDADYVYVVPVVVHPDGNEPYVAAAKLQLPAQGDPPYELVQLYDDPPPAGDNQCLNNLREIEIGHDSSLYVVNAGSLNESDILWVYNTDDGTVKRRLDLGNPDSDCHLAGPVAMHVSTTKNLLYLASSRNDPGATSVLLYVLSASDLGFARTIEIKDMGHVTDITEDPLTGTLWVVGFSMVDIPQYPDPSQSPFYHPCLAEVPYGIYDVQAQPLMGVHDLGLPLSIVWTAAEKERVNFVDLALFAAYWLESGCTLADSCGSADLTSDGNVTLDDLHIFCTMWLSQGP